MRAVRAFAIFAATIAVIVASVALGERLDAQMSDPWLKGRPIGYTVVKGLLPGFSSVDKFGRNADVDTGAYETVWDGNGIWVAPAAAGLHYVSSSDPNDTSDPNHGTGARTMDVYGLDANYALINETVSLNGSSAVATSKSYTMIHRMIVRTAGITGSNEGLISAIYDPNTINTTTAAVTAGTNQTLMAVYQVPASVTCYLTKWYASVNKNVATAAVDIRLVIKPFGEVVQVKKHRGLISTGTSDFTHYLEVPIAVTQKSIVEVRANTSADNTDVSGGFDMICEDN